VKACLKVSSKITDVIDSANTALHLSFDNMQRAGLMFNNLLMADKAVRIDAK
jgi:hypothetical protein